MEVNFLTLLFKSFHEFNITHGRLFSDCLRFIRLVDRWNICVAGGIDGVDDATTATNATTAAATNAATAAVNNATAAAEARRAIGEVGPAIA